MRQLLLPSLSLQVQHCFLWENRTKHVMNECNLGVLVRWNTPACLYPFLVHFLYAKITAYSSASKSNSIDQGFASSRECSEFRFRYNTDLFGGIEPNMFFLFTHYNTEVCGDNQIQSFTFCLESDRFQFGAATLKSMGNQTKHLICLMEYAGGSLTLSCTFSIMHKKRLKNA